jgi:ribosomal protein L29
MHDQMTAVIKLGDYLGIFESKTVEELRKLQLAKVQAETDALNRQQLPIRVEIQVQDASNPDRTRGEMLNDTETDPEHTSE